MARLVEGRLPTSVRGDTCDPGLAPVVTNRASGLIDEASPIPREHPAFMDSVKISKRVYSIGSWSGLGHRWE